MAKSPANQLTADISAQVFKDGGFPMRINTTGMYDETTKSWRPSGSTKGVSDLLVSFHGFLICIEVKIPPDKQREDQITFQKNIEHTRSIYFIATSFIQFLPIWNKIKSQLLSRLQ